MCVNREDRHLHLHEGKITRAVEQGFVEASYP
jgi:hypothetical protein